MLEHSQWRVLLNSFHGALFRQIRNRSPGEASRALFFAVRHRLLPLLPHLPGHLALLRTLSHPCSAELTKRHPSLEYKYLRTYIASELSIKERLHILQTHYQTMQEMVPSDFFARIFDTKIALWEHREIDHAFSVSISYPHSPRDKREKFDQEGDISLLFEVDSSPVYKLNFSVVPASVFGAGTGQAMFIGCLQGAYGKFDLIKAVAAACEKTHPAVLLVFAAAAIADSLGLNTMIGVGEKRQLCADDNKFVFEYDKFWEDLGGQQTSSNVFLFPLPIPFKPIESVKRPYRAKAMRKRTFILTFSHHVKANFSSTLLSAPCHAKEENSRNGISF